MPNGPWFFFSLMDERRGVVSLVVVPYPKCSKAADTAAPGWQA
jgi:hypothetical protein